MTFQVRSLRLLYTSDRRVVAAVVGAELVGRAAAALTAAVVAVCAGLRMRAGGEFLVSRIRFLNGRLSPDIQTPFEMRLEIALPSRTTEPAMLCEVLLVGGDGGLRVLVTYRVFQPMRSLAIVGGSLRPRGGRHANMVACTASFAPNEALYASVWPERTAAWLAPARGLRIVLGGLCANVWRDTDVIARPAGFAPNKSFGAGISSEIADGQGAFRRKAREGQKQGRRKSGRQKLHHLVPLQKLAPGRQRKVQKLFAT